MVKEWAIGALGRGMTRLGYGGIASVPMARAWCVERASRGFGSERGIGGWEPALPLAGHGTTRLWPREGVDQQGRC